MTRDDLNVAIMDDAAKHVRPKMMTVVSSTVLTLLVIPAI